MNNRVAMLSSNPSDEDLLRLIKAGEESAFTILYSKRHGAIYRFALQMTGCRSIAEDVTQEVFLKLICDPYQFDPSKGSLSAYLYGIARYQVLRRLRKDRGFVPIAEEAEDGDAFRPDRLVADCDPLGDLTRNETLEALRQAILALPEHYREAVVLCDLHEISYAEAAEILSCSIGTIRSRLHRGRALLADKMQAHRRVSAEVKVAKPEGCLA